jgi:hypothetical protein
LRLRWPSSWPRRGQHGQEIRVAGTLPAQGVGKRYPHGPVLVADQQIDMRNLVSFACQSFANVHRQCRQL